MDLPLVSFCIFAYNHEKFIEEAIQSAFNQEYENLEIVICDDYSLDNTAQLIKNTTQNNNCKHKITCFFGQENLGLADRLNSVTQMANGEFIIIAGGDDISYPYRTKVLVEHWLRLNKPIAVFHSKVDRINENGKFINGEIQFFSPHYFSLNDPIDIVKNMRWILGCSEAFDRRIITNFPLIHHSILNEDAVFAFRGVVMEGVYFIDNSLLKYRVGIGIGTEIFRAKNKYTKFLIYKKNALQFVALTEQYYKDYKYIGSNNDALEKEIKKKPNYCKIYLFCLF